MSANTIVKILLFALVVYVGWHSALPFIDKYVITKHVDELAQYATIHSTEDTVKEFNKRVIKNMNRDDIQLGNFSIEKDEEDETAYARLRYNDKIVLFGKTIKEFEFIIEKRAAKVDKIL
jgi:hypothetical protein